MKQTNYIKVGMGTCGIAAGAKSVYEEFEAQLKEKNIPFVLKKTGCLGLCYLEPIVEIKIGENPPVFYQHIRKEDVAQMFEDLSKNIEIKKTHFTLPIKYKKIVLRRCGIIDPETIEDYLEENGYEALKKVLFELNPEKIIEEVKKSYLRGRGGAGFPTWKKWLAAKESKSKDGERFIICNGDEGDPGAYMDRSILEGDPHNVLEGMIIAARAIGATSGIFYIRAEYPLAIERLQKAIEQATEKGFLGKKIMGSDFSFDVEIRIGAGAFVCGEETALIASVEGKRGNPRPRPPYPAQKGLWGKPTVINNVETLSNITFIISRGGEEFATIGTGNSRGTKVFALTGKIKNPSLIEVPMGTSLREIIYEIGGGISGDKEFKAVQTGGPSGGIIPKEYLDREITYESLEELGSIMGSGGMIVMDVDDCPVDIAKFFIGFCVDESCGKCAPCRIGSTQALKILEKITDGRGEIKDLEKLEKISHAMKEASLCGLGQTASKPIVSTMKYFKDEYLEHIQNKKCRSKKCTKLE